MPDSDKSFSAVLAIVLLGSLLATSAAIIGNVTAIQNRDISMQQQGKTPVDFHQYQGLSENTVKADSLPR
jgi:hypothetical protein